MREGSGGEDRGEPGRSERREVSGFPFSIEEAPGKESPRPRQAGIPLILPEARGSPRRRYRGTLLWALACLAVGGALGWALVVLTAEEAPGEEARGEPAEFRTVTLPEMEGAPWKDAAVAFSDAAVAFGERARGFDLGRLDCAGLRKGLRAVEEAFGALSGRLAAGAAERAAGRVGEWARRAMREVRRHFEASTCPFEGPAPTEGPTPMEGPAR